jgi:hypothetical protein
MNNQYFTEWQARERHQERLREAQRERLVREARAGRLASRGETSRWRGMWQAVTGFALGALTGRGGAGRTVPQGC